MARVAINTGATANDGTGDSLRSAGGIINSNFLDLYNYFGDGTNLTFTGGGTSSQWVTTGVGIHTLSNVGIGTTNPRFDLEVGAVGTSGTSLWVNGDARVTGILTIGTSSITLNGSLNKITVGSGVTIDGNTGIISATAFYSGGSIVTGSTVGIDTTGTSFFNQLNVSGVSTFNDNVRVTGIVTANSVLISNDGGNNGSVLIEDTGAYSEISFRASNGTTQSKIQGVETNLYITPGSGGFIGLGGATYNLFYDTGDVVLNNGLQGTTHAANGLRVTGLTSTTTLNVSGNVSVGGTISVDGGVQLTTNNPTIVGTLGTVGEIKQIGGAPFYYDGSAWREFVLSSGTPVSVPADTDWDNVILRSTFDTDFTDAKFGVTPVKVGTGSTIVASPVKFGAGSYRNDGSVGAGLSFAYRNDYDFTGPWTIEFWYYHDTDPSLNTPVSLVSMNSYTDGSGNWALALYKDGSSNMRFHWYNQNLGVTKTLYYVSGLTFSSRFDNKWNHLALVREPADGSLHFYVNGYEDTETATTSVIDNDILNISGAGLAIGGNGYASFTADSTINNGQTIDAHFDDIRITKVAKYTSVGIATTVFTPPTTALPTTGTLSSYVQPPGDKYGEITLGGSPTWTGTSGVTVSQQSGGNYRVSFASTYANSNDYFVLTQAMDQGFASYVGVARSTTHVDFAINKESDNVAVDTGSLSVQIKNHI